MLIKLGGFHTLTRKFSKLGGRERGVLTGFEEHINQIKSNGIAENGKQPGWQGTGQGSIKVRIRVPYEMPAPRTVTGVVLTPEISSSERNGEVFGVFGFLEALIYYDPIQFEGEIPGFNDETENKAVLDDYFLDLAELVIKESSIEAIEDKEDDSADSSVLEVLGEPRETSAGAQCIRHRIPFYLTITNVHPGEKDVIHLIPKVENVECRIIGSRVLNLQVQILIIASDQPLFNELAEEGSVRAPAQLLQTMEAEASTISAAVEWSEPEYSTANVLNVEEPENSFAVQEWEELQVEGFDEGAFEDMVEEKFEETLEDTSEQIIESAVDKRSAETNEDMAVNREAELELTVDSAQTPETFIREIPVELADAIDLDKFYTADAAQDNTLDNISDETEIDWPNQPSFEQTPELIEQPEFIKQSESEVPTEEKVEEIPELVETVDELLDETHETAETKTLAEVVVIEEAVDGEAIVEEAVNGEAVETPESVVFEQDQDTDNALTAQVDYGPVGITYRTGSLARRRPGRAEREAHLARKRGEISGVEPGILLTPQLNRPRPLGRPKATETPTQKTIASLDSEVIESIQGIDPVPGRKLAGPSRPARGHAGRRQTNMARYYLIQPDDTWPKIAAAYQITVAEIMEANPGLDGELLAGKRLKIPTIKAY